MHAALQLPEIRERLFAFCSQGTLASSIRTCRAFEDSSRNALWEMLPWLDALVALLPESTWEKGTEGREIVHHCPSPEDWARMRLYTSCITNVEIRVKSQGIGSREAMNIDSDRLLLLTSLSPPESLSPMFPKLKAMHCDMYQRGGRAIMDVQTLRWVNGPSVTHVQFDLMANPWSHENTVELTSSLSTLYPDATDVQVFIDVADYGCTPRQDSIPLLFGGLFKSIRDWKNLVHGSFQTLDPPTFEYLSRLQSLAVFHLDMRLPVVPARLQEARFPPKSFPALTKLVLSSSYVDQLDTWLHPFHLSPRELVCGVDRPVAVNENHSDLRNLCNWIAAHFCNRTLEVIILHSEHGPRYECRENWMQPLFSFTHLRRVSLSGITWTHIDDDALIQLASSWPLLEWLDLNKIIKTSKAGDTVVLPTFRGFFSLVRNCPHLRVLMIVIDTRDSGWVDVQNPCDAHNDSMGILTLGNSPVDDRGRVTQILSTIFPQLDSVYFYWSGELVAVGLRGHDSESEAV